jgi:hypothetical protein
MAQALLFGNKPGITMVAHSLSHPTFDHLWFRFSQGIDEVINACVWEGIHFCNSDEQECAPAVALASLCSVTPSSSTASVRKAHKGTIIATTNSGATTLAALSARTVAFAGPRRHEVSSLIVPLITARTFRKEQLTIGGGNNGEYGCAHTLQHTAWLLQPRDCRPSPSTLASCFVRNGVFNTLDLDAVMASTQISGSGMGATGSCTAVNL